MSKSASTVKLAVPTEAELQRDVCDYIRLKWPDAVFNSDGAGNYVSSATAAMNTALRSSSGYPDLFVAVPRGGFHGLFMELKREGTKLHKVDGSWVNDHVAQQAEVLQRLDDAGYDAWFAIGWDMAIEIVEEYFALTDPSSSAGKA